jgi:diguanylate cyclase (GGDEF)-like protein/PAS domain S-box-containing protein
MGTLRARLLAFSTLVIAASVLGTATILLERVERRSEQALMDLEASHTERLAAMLGQRVVMLQRMMRAAADEMPEPARKRPEDAAKYLHAQTAVLQALGTLFVADASGHLLAWHDGQHARSAAANLSGEAYFQRTLGGVPVVSGPVSSVAGQHSVLAFTMPVWGPGRALVAVLGGWMPLHRRNLFDDLVSSTLDEERHALTVLTDAQGVIVAHPRRERLASSVAADARMAAAAARWAQQGRPLEPAATVRRADGEVSAVVGLPGPEWVLFRTVPDGQLLGGIDLAHREALGWAAGVAVAGGAMILLLLTALLRPLARLRERVSRLGVDAGPDGWPQANGEVGELASALRSALEARVAGEREQRALMAQMSSVMAAAPIGIAIVRHGCFELASAECCALLGRGPGELAGCPAHDIFASRETYDVLSAQARAAFEAREPHAAEHELLRRDGSRFWARLSGRHVDEDNAEAGTIWLLEDVTQQRAERERLAWSARHDGLTRLLNRSAFEQELRARLADSQSSSAAEPAVLLMVDLDHFKQVNDNAGHAAGDQVLREVAAVLRRYMRASDEAARLGGDEFALLMSVGASEGLMVANRLCDAVARVGVSHEGRWLAIGASIGVAALPVEATADATVEAWLEAADRASYEAKRSGRGQACLAAALAGTPGPASAS